MDDRAIFRAHPIFIYRTLKRFTFAIILPFFKGAAQYLLYRRVSGVFLLEGIVLSVITSLGVARLIAFRITVEKGGILIEEGAIIRKKTFIPRKNLSCVTVSRRLTLDLFGAAGVTFDTEAGARGKADFGFFLSVSEAGRLKTLIFGDPPRSEIRFSHRKIALFSATASSSLTGLLVGVPILDRTGKLLNIGLDRAFAGITAFSRRVKPILPPVLNLLTVAFIAVWGAAFLFSLMRNMFFKITKDGKTVKIRSGLYFRRERIFDIMAVKNLCVLAPPLMRLFKSYTLRAAVGGTGGAKGESATVIPAASKSRINTALASLFPPLDREYELIHCVRSRAVKRRFMLLPVLYALFTAAAAGLLAAALPIFSAPIIFAAAVILVIDGAYARVCLKNYRACALGADEGAIMIKSFSGLTERVLYVPAVHTGAIKITRTPLDIRQNTCRVRVTVRSEGGDRLTARCLPYGECLRAIKKIFGING